MQRWEEEEEILQEELKRTRRSFLFMALLWSQQAELHQHKPGMAAFTWKKLHTFDKLAEDCILVGVNDTVIYLEPPCLQDIDMHGDP